MWILIVLQLVAGSATSKNSLPIIYSGVTMQEFSSQDSCERAIKEIKSLSIQAGKESELLSVRDGILSMRCIKK